MLDCEAEETDASGDKVSLVDSHSKRDQERQNSLSGVFKSSLQLHTDTEDSTLLRNHSHLGSVARRRRAAQSDSQERVPRLVLERDGFLIRSFGARQRENEDGGGEDDESGVRGGRDDEGRERKRPRVDVLSDEEKTRENQHEC